MSEARRMRGKEDLAASLKCLEEALKAYNAR